MYRLHYYLFVSMYLFEELIMYVCAHVPYCHLVRLSEAKCSKNGSLERRV